MKDTPAHILLVADNRMDGELTLDAFREARLLNAIVGAGNTFYVRLPRG